VVYFYDPDVKQYFTIPYRNTTHPPMSVWELREARRRLQEEGQKAINEDLLFDAYNRLRALEAAAVTETTKARRLAQRRRRQVQAERPQSAPVAPGMHAPVASTDKIQPFDEIEELDA
jgi:putative transposase